MLLGFFVCMIIYSADSYYILGLNAAALKHTSKLGCIPEAGVNIINIAGVWS